jgi:predicted permease
VRVGHILRSRFRSLFFRETRESDLNFELQLHLEREAERLQATGLSPDEAHRQARRLFGGVDQIKEDCRDARGTVLFESVLRDIRFSWRSFRRAPLVAVTIVTTVALGLGLIAVVFTILNAAIFRPDAVRNPSELFSITRQRSGGAEPEIFTRPQYEALLRETGVFSEAFGITSDVQSWIEGIRREGRLVTGNFFRVLGVSAARGRTLTPSDDEPGRPPVIVLSHRAWSQQYASDPDVVNRTIRVNGASFQIVGVTPEDFRGLSIIAAPDFWAPLSVLDQIRPSQGREGAFGFQIVGRLKTDISRAQGLAQLLAWDSRRSPEVSRERAMASLALESRTGTIPLSTDVMLAFVPLFFAFGLILMIGCANVANLLLARSVARQREIGIRLAIGASRRRIIWQLLIESLLLALISAALAFVISRLVLEGVVYVVIATFPADIGNIRLVVPPADWRVALFLLAGAMVSTLLFALAPALQATRVELLRAVRGEVVRDGRPGRARDGLVALQVTGSVMLLICAAVFLRSSWAAATIDPGIRTAGVLGVRVVDEQRRGAILDVLRREGSVDSVAGSWPAGFGGLGGLPASAQGAGAKVSVTYEFVTPEYFDVFDIRLVRGRGFSETERSESAAVAIVSEGVARQLWPGRDPVGQVVRVEPHPLVLTGGEAESGVRNPNDPKLQARSVAVVGVARDVAGFRLGGARLGGAGIYMPITTETAAAALTIHVRADTERARQQLVDRLAAIDPNMAEISTMRTIARAEVYLLTIPFWLTLILGVLGLLLTFSGLFSVLSYLVEQRTREIGVRMALGATSRGIVALVMSQSARPVGFGLLLGGGLTLALGAVLLATRAAAQIGSTVHVFDPLAYAAGVLWIVAACASAALIPSLRAARIDPVAALRQD